MVLQATETRVRLERWATAEYGDGASIPDVWSMPGNAGLSFGFDVVVPGREPTPLVIRLSPPGVRRSGNTDVLRQVPLLTALGGAGIPVARVTWSSADERWFGTDAMVQERLTAWPLHLWDSRLTHPLAALGAERFVDQAVDAIATVHAFGWQDCLGDWEPLRTVNSELAFWGGLLEKSDDPGWVAAGLRLREVLHETQPVDTPVGVFHGDYQTNNVLYDAGGDLAAVIDWEISGLGPQLIDLGWLCLFTDPSCWEPSYVQGMQVVVDPEVLRGRYEQARGMTVQHLGFFQALACFRFGTIAAFNVRLHRTGRRVDASYERIAPSVAKLFERGCAMAEA